MDKLDHEILQCLVENARVNATTIGERIGLSTSSVIERIRRMERCGLIQQYTTIVDLESMGRSITAFISVRLEHPKYNEGFELMVRRHPDIAECHYTAGDVDYMLKIVTASSKTLEKLLTYIKSIEGAAWTRTLLVLSTVKSELSALPSLDQYDDE
ncbi:MAG: Lrp/AsnC family transcriptional regulator [Firmicutes bacterium]|nr:Lrp/AsnC family transcriptional regulator [Bacillota bacterium]